MASVMVFTGNANPELTNQIARSLGISISNAVVDLYSDGEINIETNNEILNDLFSTGGMLGMMNTIFLVIGTMVFGGVMDAIGALKTISKALLKWADNTFKLFASTVASCLALNVSASDQYLSIVVSGKMFEKAFEDKGLTEEDALCNARLARILTNEDYDSQKQEPRLWTPTPEYEINSGTGVQIEVS